MAGLRWFQRRFEGAVVREELPPGLLEALAARAKVHGMGVVEEAPESQPSYRTAPTSRTLRLEPFEEYALWEEVRVWQDGPRVLRYAGWQRASKRGGWITVVFAPICLLCKVYLPAGVNPLLIGIPLCAFVLWLATYALLRMEARGMSRWMHDFLEGEVMRAQRAVPFGLKRDPPAEPRGPVHLPPNAPAVRVAPSDPVLAAAARVSHDAFARHEDRDPEDEVKALEAAAKRGE